MATEPYKVNFSAPPAKITADCKAVEAAFLRVEKRIVSATMALKTFGQTVGGIKAVTSALGPLDTELRNKVKDAKAATTAIGGIGKDRRALVAYRKELAALKAELASLQGQARQGLGGGTTGTPGSPRPAAGKKGKFGAMALTAGAAAGAVARDAAVAIGRGQQEAQSTFSDAVKDANAYKDSLLGLANLRGMSSGPTDAMVREQLQFAKETGLSADAARDFQLEFEGAIGGAMGAKNITPEVAKDLQTHLGTFAARYDLDPESAGRLGGILPLHKKINSGEEAAGIIAMMTEHLNLTGVGKVKTMIPAINQMSATMFDENGGRFTDPVQMAARYAATTLNSGGNPMVARSMMERVNKAMRGFSNPKVASALGEAGITLKDDYETAIRKMGAHFEKLKAQGIDPDQWMSANGIDSKFGGSVARRDIISQVAINKVVDAQNQDVRVKLKGTNVLEANKAFFASDVGKERTLANKEFATTIEQGLASADFDTARRGIRAQMAQIDPATGRQSLKASGITSVIDRFVEFTTGKSGENTRVDIELMDRLDAAGRATGKWGFWSRPSDSMRWMDMDEEGMRNEYKARAAEVRAAGGDPLTGGKLSKAAAEAARAMDNVARAAKAAEGPGGGRAPIVPPAGPEVDPKRR